MGMLFNVLAHESAAPWAAVLCMLQNFLGERADAARQACASWFHNLDQAVAGQPTTVQTPDGVNGKTQARQIQLATCFARLLWGWIQEPLRGLCNTTWPHAGQDLLAALQQGKPQLLFPGRVLGGCNARQWDKAISEKAYYDAIRCAAGVSEQDRRQSLSTGAGHPFEEMDLALIGTHSMKKTAVTVLGDNQVSFKIISLLTGAAEDKLRREYYKPSKHKQRAALASGFGELAAAVSPQASHHEYCVSCGRRRQDTWQYCPSCGVGFVKQNPA